MARYGGMPPSRALVAGVATQCGEHTRTAHDIPHCADTSEVKCQLDPVAAADNECDSSSASPVAWLHQRHTRIALCGAIGVIAFAGLQMQPLQQQDLVGWAQRALALVALSILCYSSVQVREPLLRWPHPMFWRLVHGGMLVYVLGLIAVFVAPVDMARTLLRIISPSLTGERPEENDKLYAGDCRIYTPGDAGGPVARIQETFLDLFVLPHSIGYFFTALYMRDYKVVMAMSVAWEVAEYTLQDLLPNFHECHFDHWGVDVLLTNALGMVIGMWFVRRFNLHPFPWSGAPADRQDVLASGRHMVAGVMFGFVVLSVEMNSFFLKYVLYLPPSNIINIVRLALWVFISFSSQAEFYEFWFNKHSRGMGPNLWLALLCFATEWLVIGKFMRETPLSPGAHVKSELLACWAVAITCFVLWCLLHFSATPASTLLQRLRVAGQAALLCVFVSALSYIVLTQDVGSGLDWQPHWDGF